jgi:transposase-like protein
MGRNRIQFHEGLSFPQFNALYDSEEKCEAAMEKARWPDGFRCPRCDCKEYGIVNGRRHKRYQCRHCRHQATVTAGTIMEGTKLPLTIWFLAFYLIGQAKNGISSLELSRHLGVKWDTAWLVHSKIMRSMSEREEAYVLQGKVQIDDAYLGGELPGGKAGRGSENKVPIVAAVSLSETGNPVHVKISPVSGFTSDGIADWAQRYLGTGCVVLSDGLACFRSVIAAGCEHTFIVTGGRHPNDLPEFRWINTVLGNLKTCLGGTFHAFNFDKYARRYLGAFCFRFNRRFNLAAMTERLLNAACCCGPRPERVLRLTELPG